MIEEDLQLPMPDGMADTVLFSPASSKALPGVLHLPDIGSIRETHREMARRLAAEGYVVLMPNPFYRSGRPPVFSFPRTMGWTCWLLSVRFGPARWELWDIAFAEHWRCGRQQRDQPRWQRRPRSTAEDSIRRTIPTAHTWCCHR